MIDCSSQPPHACQLQVPSCARCRRRTLQANSSTLFPWTDFHGAQSRSRSPVRGGGLHLQRHTHRPRLAVAHMQSAKQCFSTRHAAQLHARLGSARRSSCCWCPHTLARCKLGRLHDQHGAVVWPACGCGALHGSWTQRHLQHAATLHLRELQQWRLHAHRRRVLLPVV